VTVAVVAYESAAVIERCLAAVDPRAAELVVVDNASRDDTARRVAAVPRARLVRLARNEGYGAAANRAFADAATRYGLLLNADVALAPDAIERLVAAAERYPDAALLAPAMRTPDGALQFGRAIFLRPRPARGPAPPPPEGDCCAWYVGGAVMLLRLDAFRRVGGFDEALFLFYEDDDLCARLSAAGFSLVHVADAAAEHLAGRSSAGVADLDWWKQFHEAWSRCHVERKHRGAPGLARHLLRSLPGAAAKALLYRLGVRRHRRHDARLAGALAFLAGRPARAIGLGR
jgi:GT2 family glycosyltransferase